MQRNCNDCWDVAYPRREEAWFRIARTDRLSGFVAIRAGDYGIDIERVFRGFNMEPPLVLQALPVVLTTSGEGRLTSCHPLY